MLHPAVFSPQSGDELKDAVDKCLNPRVQVLHIVSDCARARTRMKITVYAMHTGSVYVRDDPNWQ